MIFPQRILAVSPHLDDAALSAGATLADFAAAGSEIDVCTLFAGAPREPLSPVARNFHTRCGLAMDASAIEVRIDEDRTAMTELGVRAQHCSFLDAVYRRTPNSRWLCRHHRAMFDDLPIDQGGLLGRLVDEVGRYLTSLRPDLVLTCAAVGGHVDHRLTRAAVTHATRVADVQTVLWEDLPYAIATPTRRNPAEQTRPAPPDAWARKWRAIACYRTQVNMLWPADSDWASALLAHAKLRGDGSPAEMFFRVRV